MPSPAPAGETVESTPSSEQPDPTPEPAKPVLGSVVAGSSDVNAGTRPLPNVTKMWADGGYAGALEKHLLEKHGVALEIVRRSDDRSPEMWVAPGEAPTPRSSGFKLIKWRWIVERTFGWLARFRRLAHDSERTAEVLAGWHWLAFVTLMLQRLAVLASPGS